MTLRALVRTSLRKIIMECQARLTETLSESNAMVTIETGEGKQMRGS